MADFSDDRRVEQEAWLDGAHERARNGRIPGWAKFCGCGCAVALLLLVALVFIVVRDLGRAADQDVQRERLAEVVPFDGSLPNLELFGFPWFLDFWRIDDERGYLWFVVETEGAREEQRAQFFSKDPDVQTPMLDFHDVEDVELGEIEIQGRTLQVKRFYQTGSALLESFSPSSVESDGASVFVDIAPAEGERMVLVLIVAVDRKVPITDEELRGLLAPFHVGPVREAYVDPEPGSAPDDVPPPAEDR